MDDLRIDESRGDIYRQVIDDAPGYPDRHYLEQQRRLALSGEVTSSVREHAIRLLGDVAFTYGSKMHAAIIRRSLDGDNE